MGVSALFVWATLVWSGDWHGHESVQESLSWLMLPGFVAGLSLGANVHGTGLIVIAGIVNFAFFSGLVYGVLALVAKRKRGTST